MQREVRKPRRRAMRLKGYDYSRPGYYFVTICTNKKEILFGQITKEEMRLSKAGHIVKTVWHELPRHYADVKLDFFVIMPNHIHAIIDIVWAGMKPASAGHRERRKIVGAQFIAPKNMGTRVPIRADPAKEGAMNRAPTIGILNDERRPYPRIRRAQRPADEVHTR